MPAYRERLYICPRKNGQPIQIVDFPLWWDRRAFFSEYGERRIDTGNPFYVDYGLLLTSSEANAWDKRCVDTFDDGPHSRKPHIAEVMHTLKSMLTKASWVVVESTEWESGLD